MSNPISPLALSVYSSSTTVEEPTNLVILQDAHEYQDVPGISSLNGSNSNTEAQNPPTQTQSQDDPDHQNNKKTNTPPAPRRSTRIRCPSLQKAQSIYEEAVRAIQRELAEFEAQKYLFKPLEELPSTDIRPRYRRLRMREQALLLASEDLCPLLEKSGLMQDVRKIQEEVDYLLTPITNIKLTYMDQVSNVTGSVRQEADAESIDQPMPTHQHTLSGLSPCRVTTPLQDTVYSSTTNSPPSNTVTTDTLSGGISSTMPPPNISSPTHYHAVVCNSATCLGDRVITTPCLTPQGVTPLALNPTPPHHTTSSPQQINQAPREHTPPPSAQLVSRKNYTQRLQTCSKTCEACSRNFITKSRKKKQCHWALNPPTTR